MLKKLMLLCLLFALPAFAQQLTVRVTPVYELVHIAGISFFQAAGHSVALSWAASPDVVANPTLNYNVYRMQLASSASTCSASAMNKLSTADAATSFSDIAVSVGGMYCYAVTAALNGSESAFSNTASATIPIAPPGNLNATAK